MNVNRQRTRSYFQGNPTVDTIYRYTVLVRRYFESQCNVREPFIDNILTYLLTFQNLDA